MFKLNASSILKDWLGAKLLTPRRDEPVHIQDIFENVCGDLRCKAHNTLGLDDYRLYIMKTIGNVIGAPSNPAHAPTHETFKTVFEKFVDHRTALFSGQPRMFIVSGHKGCAGQRTLVDMETGKTEFRPFYKDFLPDFLADAVREGIKSTDDIDSFVNTVAQASTLVSLRNALAQRANNDTVGKILERQKIAIAAGMIVFDGEIRFTALYHSDQGCFVAGKELEQGIYASHSKRSVEDKIEFVEEQIDEGIASFASRIRRGKSVEICGAETMRF